MNSDINMAIARRTASSLRVLALGLLVGICAGQTSTPASNPPVQLRQAKLAEMDAAIEQAIATKKCPGGVLWFEHSGESYHKAFGLRAVVPQPEPMTEDTIFDAASLTKVVACTP